MCTLYNSPRAFIVRPGFQLISEPAFINNVSVVNGGPGLLFTGPVLLLSKSNHLWRLQPRRCQFGIICAIGVEFPFVIKPSALIGFLVKACIPS